MLSMFKRRTPEVPPAPPPVTYHLDWFWCDPSGMFFRGWIHAHGVPITALSIQIGEDVVEIAEFQERPEVAPHFPDFAVPVKCGFEAYVPSVPGNPVRFHVSTAEHSFTMPVEIPRRETPPPPTTSPIYGKFIDTVNTEKLVVLELGSRIVGPMSTNNRKFYPGASKYIGMDVHPSPNVDVVGDVHELSSLIGEASIDAIYSVSVFEHLERPWIVAEEMNRALRMGGLVFHSTVHSWPIHEYPNDFWRFSDEGLKVLFGPAFGFEVVEAAMTNPVDMYPRMRYAGLLHLPLNPGFLESCVLARKVAEVGTKKSEIGQRALLYPYREDLE